MRAFPLRSKRFWATLAYVAVAIAVISLSGIGITKIPEQVGNAPAVTIGIGDYQLTVGTAYASETPDYTCDGVADDVQFQQALDALPAVGGKIRILAGTYSFTAATTVTRAIPNVIWEGVGGATVINCDGVTAVFTAGSNGWRFINFATDAGGVAVGATTGWSKQNLLEGATFTELSEETWTANQVAIFGANDNVTGDTDLTFTGGNTLVVANATINTNLLASLINPSTATDITLWGGTQGTGRVLYSTATNADAGNTLRDAPTITNRAYYWNAANIAWDYNILHDMTAAGAAPASKADHSINAVTVLSLYNTNGTVAGVFPNNCTVGQAAPNTGYKLYVTGDAYASTGWYSGGRMYSNSYWALAGNVIAIDHNINITAGVANHEIELQIDANNILRARATGDGAGGVTNLRAVADYKFGFDAVVNLTIDGAGAVAATQAYHKITVTGGAGSGADNLDTISGGNEGDILIIRPSTTGGADTVTVRDGAGNILLDAAGNFAMDNVADTLTLIYDGANWLEMSRSNNA